MRIKMLVSCNGSANKEGSVSFNYNIINTGINDTLTIDFE